MELKIFQVDAFTSEVFKGNPAAVCPVESWPEDELLQNIARENNLSETAFFIPSNENIALRWFTPAIEVKLCGHATLAAATIIFESFENINHPRNSLTFDTLSGNLTASKLQDGRLELDFPREPYEECDVISEVADGLGARPATMFKGVDIGAVFNSQEEIMSLEPDMGLLKKFAARGIIATARGNEVDFVSRFFAPGSGIDEDPVTGSAHCMLAPYWSKVLQKTILTAHQLSERGGILECELSGDRVLLRGHAVKYMQGTLTV